MKKLIILSFLSMTVFPSICQLTLSGFGDSITATAIPGQEPLWFNLVAAENGFSTFNHAEVGANMYREGEEHPWPFTYTRQFSVTGTNGFATIMYGANDDPSQFWEDKLVEYINTDFINKGYSAKKIILIAPAYNKNDPSTTQYNQQKMLEFEQRVNSAANRTHVSFLDFYKYVSDTGTPELYLYDQYHLTRLGNRTLANLVNGYTIVNTPLPIKFNSLSFKRKGSNSFDVNFIPNETTRSERFVINVSDDGGKHTFPVYSIKPEQLVENEMNTVTFEIH